MNDIATIIPTINDKLGKLQIGQCLDMRTFKRDRSIIIVCAADNTYNVIERGFYEETWEGLTAEKVKKLMKTLLKREFPRSNKVRLYTLDSLEDANVNRSGHGSGKFGG